VILDRDGVVIVMRKPEATGYSEPKTIEPVGYAPPSSSMPRRKDHTLTVLLVLAFTTIVLLTSALGYVGYSMLAPRFQAAAQPSTIAEDPEAIAVVQEPVPPPPAPARQAVVLPAELRVPTLLERDQTAAPRGAAGRFTAEREATVSGQMKARGNDLRRQGDLERAREYYRAAIQADASYFEGYNNLGNTYTDTGDHGAARPIYEQGLSIVPESETIRFNLGNSLMRAGRYHEAAQEFERVIYYNQSDVEARLLLGICYYHLGRLNDSANVFLAILARQKDHPEANYNLALVMDRLGRGELADAYRREAFRVKPELARR
jgi:tetratricopeptide (TPR) repeat protein